MEAQLRDELTRVDPENRPFVDPFNEEQLATVKERSETRFEAELKEKYDGVMAKARRLVQLAVPKAFIEAQRAATMGKLKEGIRSKVEAGLDLFRNRSTVNSGSTGVIGPSLGAAQKVARRASLMSKDGSTMTIMNKSSV